MIVVRKPLNIAETHPVPVKVSREVLAKRRWRCAATDGTEFGFDLEEPLRDGSIVHATGDHVYVVRQSGEAVLEVEIGDSQEAARVGWMLGNLHFVVEIAGNVIRVADDVAVRRMFEREGIRFEAMNAVFKPIVSGGHHHH